MDQKKISVTTVANRMKCILNAYREQCLQEQDGAVAVPSTSSSSSTGSVCSSSSLSLKSSSELKCTPQRKMDLDKEILKYASHGENEIHSDSDCLFDIESPPKRRRKMESTRYMKSVDQKQQQKQEPQQPKRRRQPGRTVKRSTIKVTSTATINRAKRNVTCTVTSNPLPNSSLSDDSSSVEELIFPD